VNWWWPATATFVVETNAVTPVVNFTSLIASLMLVRVVPEAKLNTSLPTLPAISMVVAEVNDPTPAPCAVPANAPAKLTLPVSAELVS